MSPEMRTPRSSRTHFAGHARRSGVDEIRIRQVQVPACGHDVECPSGAGRRDVLVPGARGSWRRCDATGEQSAGRPRPPKSRPLRPGCAAPEGHSDRGGSGCPWVANKYADRRKLGSQLIQVLPEHVRQQWEWDDARLAALPTSERIRRASRSTSSVRRFHQFAAQAGVSQRQKEHANPTCQRRPALVRRRHSMYASARVAVEPIRTGQDSPEGHPRRRLLAQESSAMRNRVEAAEREDVIGASRPERSPGWPRGATKPVYVGAWSTSSRATENVAVAK